jgi:hypothetical protein
MLNSPSRAIIPSSSKVRLNQSVEHKKKTAMKLYLRPIVKKKIDLEIIENPT